MLMNRFKISCLTREMTIDRNTIFQEKLRAACEAFEGRLKAVFKNKG